MNGDVINLFRIVQRHAEALLDEIRYTLASRRGFEELRRLAPQTLTDVQRAARFYYWQRLAFSGRPGNTSFAMTPLQGKGRAPEVIAKHLRAAHKRLATVTIENLPYERFIAGYDRPQTLFYLDPPYWGHEGLFGKALFERADFERLAGLLRGLKGRVILSLNDVPEIREIFVGFALEETDVRYSTKPGAKRGKELIISGQ